MSALMREAPNGMDSVRVPRLIRVRSWPSAASCFVTAALIMPVPPMTKIFISSLFSFIRMMSYTDIFDLLSLVKMCIRDRVTGRL